MQNRFLLSLLAFVPFVVQSNMLDMKELYLSEAPVIDESQQKPFEMSSELGVLLSAGNNPGGVYTAKLNANHNTPEWFTTYNSSFLYKQNEVEVDGVKQDAVSAHKVFASVQADYKLEQPKNRLFIYGEYENDRFNVYDYQASIAAGYSAQLWQTDESAFRYSIGPGYAVSKLDSAVEGKEHNGFIVRAALEYETKVSEGATFRQFFSTETDAEYARSVSETALAAQISGSLAMKLSLNMIHNHQQSIQEASLSTETSVTLVYNFF